MSGRYLPSLPLAFRIARFFEVTVDKMFDPDDGEAGIVGWVIYRDRGEGDDSAAERAGSGAGPYRIGP